MKMKREIITDFTDFGNREWKDRLHGGKADDRTPEDFDPDYVSIGTAVEMEHTNNPDIATEISLDHDQENDTYYGELIMSGIADEKDAINMFDKSKTKEEKEMIISKIQKNLNKEKEKLNSDLEDQEYDDDEYDDDMDDDMDDDFDDMDDDMDDNIKKDDLVGKDGDFDEENDELILDDDEGKSNENFKYLKKFNNFIKK